MSSKSVRDERATRLLERLARGDFEAQRQFFPLVYDELRRLAAQQLGAAARRHTIQPTALVHEVWIRLIRQEAVSIECRAQFFALAGQVMRSVLVDHARAKAAARRGRGWRRITLGDAVKATRHAEVDLLVLDEALERLAAFDPDLARVVEMRFFGGLDNAEVAAALGTSLRTVERNWRLARAWLHGELSA